MKKFIVIIAALCSASFTHTGHVHIVNGTQYPMSAGVTYPNFLKKSDWFGMEPGQAGDSSSATAGEMTGTIELYVYDKQQSVFDKNYTKQQTARASRPNWTKPLSLAGNTVQTLIVRQGVDDNGKVMYWVEH